MPPSFKYKDQPKIIYKRSPTIARKIFNYKATVNSLNCHEWTSSNNSCDCKTSIFCDPHHGHIMTGNLQIIKNSRLRSLLTKGPKYREKERINWDKVQSKKTLIDELKRGVKKIRSEVVLESCANWTNRLYCLSKNSSRK